MVYVKDSAGTDEEGVLMEELTIVWIELIQSSL